MPAASTCSLFRELMMSFPHALVRRPEWVAARLSWVLPLFFAGLVFSAGLAKACAILLALLGVLAVCVPGRRIDALDCRFMLAAAILPAAYVLNMALLGWNFRLLDRPAHLLAGVAVYLLFRRFGVARVSVLRGLAIAGLGGMLVALAALAWGGGEGLLALNSGRPMGPFSSPGPFGNYSAVVAMAALAGGLAASNGRLHGGPPLMVPLAIIGGTAAAILSETRSAWTALPLMALLALQMPGRRRLPRRPLALAGVLLLLVVVLIGQRIWGRVEEGVVEVLAYLADPAARSARETSLGLRLLSWQWGWEQFLAHPLLGLGMANFRAAVAAGVAAGVLPPILMNFGGLHNLFIDHLTTTGLVGLLAMLAFWIGMLGFFASQRRVADPDKRLFATWGLMLLLGEFVFSNVGSMFASSLGALAFTVMLAVFAAGAHPATPAR